jgi:hypothetical protein
MMIQRRGEQAGRSRQALSWRPIFASVLAAFLILQGLAAVCSSLAYSARAGEGAVVFSPPGANCVLDAQDDHHSPVHEHSDAQCCVLCGARDFNEAAIVAVALIVASLEPPQPSSSTDAYSAEAPLKPPAGWASSWSSRAPPFFS